MTKYKILTRFQNNHITKVLMAYKYSSLYPMEVSKKTRTSPLQQQYLVIDLQVLLELS